MQTTPERDFFKGFRRESYLEKSLFHSNYGEPQGGRPHTMKHQAIRSVALMLSVLLIAAVPVQAGTITYGDVIALATINGQSGRSSVDLRLRSVTQQQSGGASSQDKQTVSGSAQQQQERKNIPAPTGGSSAGGADSSLTGATVPSQQQPGSVQVETIELGDIQGTICDCGEILTPKGGFPKLPLLALAGIPLLFLGGGTEPPTEIITTPTPPPPPPPQVPEPATLLLLGSGLAALGAGARRRRAARSNDEGGKVLEVRGA
jgi:PEP-CTERM motif